MRIRLLLPIAFAAIVVPSVSGQQAFQIATRLIRLDVSVLDGRRQSVRDLMQADFRITERGKPLTIRSFATVAVPPGEGPGSSPLAASSSPDVVVRGEAAAALADANPGRLIVLILDDSNTPENPKWAEQARRIARSIVQQMGPRDRMAIQFTRVAATELALTTDRAALLATIDRFMPGGGFFLFGDHNVVAYRRAIDGLAFTVEALAGLTYRQKLLVYIGAGLPIDYTTSRGFHGDFTRYMHELFREAERANAVLYTFDPTGVDGLSEYIFDKVFLAGRTQPFSPPRPAADVQIQASREASRAVAFTTSIAENTGGRALVRTDTFEPAVAQMFADTSFYYLIAVEPLDAKPDDRFHEVSVKVSRRDVQVRARRGYYYMAQ